MPITLANYNQAHFNKDMVVHTKLSNKLELKERMLQSYNPLNLLF